MNPHDKQHSISNCEERGHDRKLSREYYDYIATQYATYPIHHIGELGNALSDYSCNIWEASCHNPIITERGTLY